MITKGIDIGFKDVDVKKGIVKGSYAKYNVIDLHRDIAEIGMFNKSIVERGPKGKRLIKFLIDHDKTKVPGVITDLYDEAEYAMYEMKVGNHSLGVDFAKMVESDIFNQHSFGYSEVKTQYDEIQKANRLKEVKLYEISAIQFLGANPETTIIGLKSATDALAYLENLEKFIRTTDCTDDTIIQLETKLKSLTELLKPSIDTYKNQQADVDQIKNLLKTFGKNGH
jgi:HK97 family phage prohead protease